MAIDVVGPFALELEKFFVNFGREWLNVFQSDTGEIF
jgi:hypothetical protein